MMNLTDFDQAALDAWHLRIQFHLEPEYQPSIDDVVSIHPDPAADIIACVTEAGATYIAGTDAVTVLTEIGGITSITSWVARHSFSSTDESLPDI